MIYVIYVTNRSGFVIIGINPFLPHVGAKSMNIAATPNYILFQKHDIQYQRTHLLKIIK